MRAIPVIGWTDGEQGEIQLEEWRRIGRKPKRSNASIDAERNRTKAGIAASCSPETIAARRATYRRNHLKWLKKRRP